ncbi:SRPBCC domain-containing protein [Phycicoccus endophyticus]|uniref:SRPBCC domain-containing protein n=1 Tax=Phycicoccus endophyticus TaxID=1690220 RepID=A0A7G9R0B4_9MICO|nr:SRPBCC domain-containing protein [Phycicoccus endophyticus]NHI20151.1 hypothetical protein [Phycicoccus endophyticus]QNN49039.1 SRPBCC domain-containing protein [Phycicoccus endophyticus]GGL38013.1 hypothetical protein GCM10012283_20720 [Phycicoccus endophyticus]
MSTTSTTGTMHAQDDERGLVRVEDVYDTDVEDLWRACTDPERLARIDVCEAPHHLLLTQMPGTDEETELEAWLTPEGSGTRLVVEERGVPRGALDFYGSGWQVHLEDLGRSLAADGSAHPEGWSSAEAAPSWKRRWEALVPEYEAREVTTTP